MKYISIFLFLGFAGCAAPALDPIIVKNVPVTVPVIAKPVYAKVQWHVLPSSQVVGSDFTLSAADVVFALDAQDYKNLTTNVLEMKSYSDQQETVIQMLTTIVNRDSTATPKK